MTQANPTDNGDNDSLTNELEAVEQEHNLEAKRIYVPLDNLALDPAQVRHGVKKDEDFEALVDSIKDDGLLTDLLVRPVETSEMDYTGDSTEHLIIAGSRRFAALNEAYDAEDGVTVPCKVIEVDDETAHRLSLHDNTARSDLTTHELTTAINRQYEYMRERLIPSDEPVACPVEECEKEPNGRNGLKRHLSQAHGIKSGTDEAEDLMDGRYLSVREICEEIASGHPLDWRTIKNVVRVSKLPAGAMSLIKTSDELTEADRRALTKWDIEDAPGDDFDGDGVSREHIALAQLNEASDIDSDDRRSTLLIRAFAEHMDEETDLTLTDIRQALVAWQDEGIDADEAFEKALRGATPEPEEPEEPEVAEPVEEPATAPEDAEPPETPDEDEPAEVSSEVPETVSDTLDEAEPGTVTSIEADEDEDDTETEDEPEPEPEESGVDADKVVEHLEGEVDADEDLSHEEFMAEVDEVIEGATAALESTEPESEPEPEPEDVDLVDPDAPEPNVPIEMTPRFRNLIDALPASIEELADALDTDKQEVYRRMSTLREELGEDVFIKPTKETTYYFEGDYSELDELDEKFRTEVNAMPATTEDIAAAAGYAEKTVTKHIRQLREYLGDDAIRSETDDAFGWNGPTHDGMNVMLSFKDDGTVTIEPEGVLSEAHVAALRRSLD